MKSLTSYEVSHFVTISAKTYTQAERLIIPAAIILRMLSEFAAKLISSISLTKNTVHRRIVDMSTNIQKTLFIKLSISDIFALQLDESTDIAS